MEVSGGANGVSFSGTDDWEHDEKLLQPYTHVLNTSCKGTRARLLQAFNYWLNLPEDKLAIFEEVLDMYYVAFLLLDDIDDNCFMRGGIPTAHIVYGVASTISAAMYVFFISLQRVLSFNSPDMTKFYTKMILEAWRGLAMEIYWRDNHICPSEEEYMEMVNRKARELFKFGVQMMQLCSENKADFTKLTRILGLYFNIRDDYCDLCLHEHSEGKGYGDDITEGKFGFPIIHAIKSRPDDHQVSSIMRQRTEDVELKKYCVALLKKFGSLKYTRQTLEELDAELRAEIAKFGGNPMLEDILDKLLGWKGCIGDKHPEKL